MRPSDVSLAESRPLDRDSFVPLYFQLAEVLKEKLETGAWESGARFPSEREIAQMFGVSRTVIRPALKLLVDDGGLVRVRGSGTFVAPSRLEVPVIGLVKALVEPRDELRVSVLSARARPPDRTVAQVLQTKRNSAPVTQVTAVVHIDGRPVCLVDSYSPATRIPWLLREARALERGEKEVAEPRKLTLTGAQMSLQTALFGAWGASQVGVSAGDLTLMGRLVQFARIGKSERPVEFARLIYRSDSVQLVVDPA